MSAIEPDDIESLASNINDHDLATDHHAIDTDEEVVPGYTFEDIELIIETTITGFVSKGAFMRVLIALTSIG